MTNDRTPAQTIHAGYATPGRDATARATRHRLDRLVPATLRTMIADLLDAMGDVRAGTLDPRQASALAALGGVVTRAYSVGVLESRIEALEDQRADDRGQDGGTRQAESRR